jgi:hypothetical protein
MRTEVCPQTFRGRDNMRDRGLNGRIIMKDTSRTQERIWVLNRLWVWWKEERL